MKVAGNIECFSGELLRWAAKRPHDYLKDTGFERHSDEVLGKHGFVWLDVWFDVTGTAGIAPVQKRTIVNVGCGLRSKLAGIDCLKRPSVSESNSMGHGGHCGQSTR